MKKETTTWLRNFLSSFLAAVCGIAITFGINNCVGATKKAETARLLAEQTVKKMGRTHQQMHEYQALYDTIDPLLLPALELPYFTKMCPRAATTPG